MSYLILICFYIPEAYKMFNQIWPQTSNQKDIGAASISVLRKDVSNSKTEGLGFQQLTKSNSRSLICKNIVQKNIVQVEKNVIQTYNDFCSAEQIQKNSLISDISKSSLMLKHENIVLMPVVFLFLSFNKVALAARKWIFFLLSLEITFLFYF